MRILCTARPLAGHVEPLVPLAAAAAARGHEVAFATGEPAATRLRERGHTCFTAGRGADARNDFAGRIAELATAPPEARRAAFFAELFAGIELVPRLADLDAVVRDWRPDLIVHEAAELAGPPAAALAGIPWVTVGFGAVVPVPVLEAAAAATAPHWLARGLEPAPLAGFARHLYLDPFPPSLQLPEIARHPSAPVRLTPPVVTPPDPPAGLHGAADRPLIYVTFGTVWNAADRFRLVLDAVEDLAAVVVTTGAGVDPGALGPRPPNVQVHAFVPQATLLPFCDAVVCHGGSGTLLGAAAHALPQVVLPQGADQFANAELLARAGAGRMLAGDVAAADVRAAAVETLSDGPLREAARRVRDELDAMPAPGVAVRLLEQLAA